MRATESERKAGRAARKERRPPMRPRLEIEQIAIDDILKVRRAHLGKFGTRKPDTEWLATLVEGVGEAAYDIREDDVASPLYPEVVRVAAVALAWAEALIARSVGASEKPTDELNDG